MIDFGLGITLKAPVFNEQVLEWRNDPKIWRWTRQNDLIPLAQHADWFDRQWRDPTIKMYGIHAKASLVGVCGLTSINQANRNAEFSLYIAPKFQGRGLSRPALKTLFFHGFKNMNLHMIWGETFSNNPAQRLFRDIGMSEDGLKRQSYFKDGTFWDALIFSVLKDEFIEKFGDKSCFT